MNPIHIKPATWGRRLRVPALAMAAGAAVCSAWAQTTLPATPPVSPTQVVDLEYDAEGQPTKTIVDKVTTSNSSGLGLTSSQHYNPLGQLDQSADPKNGVTKLEYDGQGRLTKVTDPLGLVTSYGRNGIGYLREQNSPDAGVFYIHQVNAAGDPVFWANALGTNATLTYDANGRVTTANLTLGRSVEDYTWTYDQTGPSYGAGIGHLTSTSTAINGMTSTGALIGISTTYQYDNKGRVVGQTQTVPSQVNGVATNLVQGVTYAYNGGDRLTSIVYPSGRKVSFNYAAGAAQPGAITLQATAAMRPSTVLGSIAWQPFGPVRSWKWRAVTDHVRSFDDSGRLTRYPLGLHTRDVSYDSAGRISGYKHYLTSTGAATPTLDQSFGYDKNSQLTSINLSATSWVIDYDANGNRKSVTIGANTRVYGSEVVAGTTTPKSNRLKTLSNPAVSLTHQATGQTLSDASGASYSYYRNGSIRLIMLPGRTQSVGFMYDANGQRLRKYTDNQVGSVWVVDEASQIHFVYDQAGHLLGEYDKTGTALREYIWLDDVPVAMFTSGATASAAPIVYYIHTDHLNTPRAVVDTAGNLRWRWIADPFGTAVPETNPAGLGAFVQNLRFPGQYADSETGLFYNMARYYDPMLGRYVESDPIGLAGGINTYGYVGGNPVGNTDPWGLVRITGIPGADAETSVHANPGPEATDFRPDHGPDHVHLGTNDGPRVRTSDFQPLSKEDALKMSRKQKKFCEGLSDISKENIRKAQKSIFKHGKIILQIQAGGLLSIAAACRADPVWCAEQIEAGNLP